MGQLELLGRIVWWVEEPASRERAAEKSGDRRQVARR
jgi:hypothetical protein